MKYEMKNRPAHDLTQRRAEILAEWRFYKMEPMTIGREPISIELALQLGMIGEAAE
jgi:hypothetical protein